MTGADAAAAVLRSSGLPDLKIRPIEGQLSDPAFAKAAAYVKRLLPQARSVRVPGAAHMLHIDQPELWIEAVASAKPLLTNAPQNGTAKP